MLFGVWQVEVHRGEAATFHARAVPEPITPSMWWFEVSSPALVLGSSEPMEHVDVDACTRRGVAVVRRRSGGGAVLLEPGDALWVDVLIPRDDPRWTDDIGRSGRWLGACWQAALGSLGVDGTHVHEGSMIHTPWSDRVCFAGVGGGELMQGNRKVVGVSQRRTRAGARFQCALYRIWRPEVHAALFSPPGPTADDLRNVVATVDAPFAAVMAAFAGAVTAS